MRLDIYKWFKGNLITNDIIGLSKFNNFPYNKF